MLRGHYDKAINLYRKLLVHRTHLVGFSHTTIAVTLGWLAEGESLRCNFKESLKLIKAAIEMNRRFLKSTHPEYLHMLNIKIRIAVVIGKHEMSVEGAEDCLSRRKDSLSPLVVHPAIADSLWTLAEAQRHAGQPRQALKNYEECHQMRCKLYPLRRCPHAATCQSLFGISQCYLDKGTWALQSTRLVLVTSLYETLAESLAEPTLPDVEMCRLQLALSHILLADFTAAQPLLAIAGKRLSLLLGPRHTHVAESLYVLGTYHFHTGKYSHAKQLFGRCTDQLLQILEPRHPWVIRAQLAMCENYRMVGYFQEAIDQLNTILLVVSTSGDAFSGAALDAQTNNVRAHSMHSKLIYARSKTLRDVGNYEEATKFFSFVLETFIKEYGNKSVFVALVLGDMGECLRLEKSDEADAYLREARKCREASLGVTHPSVAEVAVSQAVSLIDNMRTFEGIAMIEAHALPVLLSSLGPGHPLTVYASGCVGLGLTIASMTAASVEGRSAEAEGGANSISLVSDSTTRRQQSAMRSSFGSGAGAGAGVGVEAETGAHSNDKERIPSIDERGQTLIAEALSALSDYPLSPFGDSHPWVLELGGYEVLGQRSSVDGGMGEWGGVGELGEGGVDGGGSYLTMTSGGLDGGFNGSMSQVELDSLTTPLTPGAHARRQVDSGLGMRLQSRQFSWEGEGQSDAMKGFQDFL